MAVVVRRGAVASVLGMAAPICLLAVAWVADRAFHHRSRPVTPSDRGAIEPAEPEQARQQALNDLLKTYGRVCAGPEGVEDCTPFAIEYMLAGKFRALGVTRSELERRWLADLSDPVAPFGLAWLGSKRAVPALRDRLLGERSFDRWRTKGVRNGKVVWMSGPVDDHYHLFSDDQFPRQRAMIAAIERISGRPLPEVVKLSDAERLRLYRDAEGCQGWRAATWLLHRLDGAPLSTANQNRAKRIACDGPSGAGDPG
jgi:hypothetical protein